MINGLPTSGVSRDERGGVLGPLHRAACRDRSANAGPAELALSRPVGPQSSEWAPWASCGSTAEAGELPSPNGHRRANSRRTGHSSWCGRGCDRRRGSRVCRTRVRTERALPGTHVTGSRTRACGAR